MAVGILQFIPGGVPTPPLLFLLFQSAGQTSRVKGLLAAAVVLVFVWSLIRLLRGRKRR